MLVQCCVCKKVRHGRDWTDAPPSLPEHELVSHGYCPECASAVYAMINCASRAPRQQTSSHQAVSDDARATARRKFSAA